MNIKSIETEYNGYRFRSRLEARWAVFFDALHVPYEYEPEGFDLGDGTYYLPDFRLKCYGTRGRYAKNKNIDYPFLDDYEIVWQEPFDLYVEVKGQMTKEDMKKIKKFAYGSIPFEITCPEGYGEVKYNSSSNYDYEDGWHHECTCRCGCLLYRENGDDPEIYERMRGPFQCALNQSIMVGEPRYCITKIQNPILIVGNIPSFMGSHDSIVGSYDRMNGCEIYPFNYELIDGDHFAAYPAAHNGKFYLWGDDSNYINKEDVDNVERAYDAARKARFEHGEKPIFF